MRTFNKLVRDKIPQINKEKGIALIKNTRKDIIKKLKQSEKEIENGEGIDSDMAFKELRLKYGYKPV